MSWTLHNGVVTVNYCIVGNFSEVINIYLATILSILVLRLPMPLKLQEIEFIPEYIA